MRRVRCMRQETRQQEYRVCIRMANMWGTESHVLYKIPITPLPPPVASSSSSSMSVASVAVLAAILDSAAHYQTDYGARRERQRAAATAYSARLLLLLLLGVLPQAAIYTIDTNSSCISPNSMTADQFMRVVGNCGDSMNNGARIGTAHWHCDLGLAMKMPFLSLSLAWART